MTRSILGYNRVRLAAVVIAIVLVGLLAVALLGRVSDSDPAVPAGAAGIGDAYFPLDGNGSIDVQHYEVHNEYDFESGQLVGWTRVTLIATSTVGSFNLDFLLPVRGVRVDDEDVDFEISSGHEVVIAQDLQLGETVEVVVRYAGRPGDYTYERRLNWLADDNEVITMGEPHMATWWFPANDHPRDKATMDIHITVPKELQVISNGQHIGRRVEGEVATTHWRAVEPMAPYLAFFAAGRFSIAQGNYQGLPWYSAVSQQVPRSQRLISMRLMKRTPRIVSWLEEALGPYPFSTTGGVTTALPTGIVLENQTRPTYPVLPGKQAVSTVVHELAHQWFGDSVSIGGWRDIWLNEGAARFMEWVYAEDQGGPSAAQQLRTTYDEYPVEDSLWSLRIDDPGPGNLFEQPIYDRGAMTLAALKNRLGSDTFWQVMRTWLRDNAGGNVTTAQFVAVAESISGEDLSAFFRAWLKAPTKPANAVANGLE